MVRTVFTGCRARGALVYMVAACLFAMTLSAHAQNDNDTLRERITGGADGVHYYDLSELVPPLGGDDEAWIAQRRALASRMAQRELTDMLETWSESESVLGGLERLRHTDFSLTSRSRALETSGDGAQNIGTREGFGVRLRLSETVRLRVSNGALQRDIFYDVVGQHAWVELYGTELKDGRTGLSLTNEYLGDEDVARILFTIRHRLQ